MEIPTKVVRYFLGMTRSDGPTNSNFAAPPDENNQNVKHRRSFRTGGVL